MKRYPIVTLFLLLFVGLSFLSSTLPEQSIVAYNTRKIKRVVQFIAHYYIDAETLEASSLLKSSLQHLQLGIPPFLGELKKGRIVGKIDREPFSIKAASLTLDKLPDVLGELMTTIVNHYSGPLTTEEIEEMVLTGLLNELDPHSTYLPTKVYKEFKIGTRGNFGGLGIVIGLRDEYLTVISPLEGTPAFAAGIKSGDRIVQIGEESTINMSLTEAVEKLRGKPNTKVSLLVERNGIGEPLHFELTRSVIRIDAVQSELVGGGQVGLIRIKHFQEDTTTQLGKAITKLKGTNPHLKGLILDLRNNPGGLLDQAVSVADVFLDKGVVVSTSLANRQKSSQEYARPGESEEKTPLIVLINEGSASASEIVAGALQKHDRALIIGHQSFGKGTVQSIYDLRDGSAVKLTIAQYLLSGDVPVQAIGIIPDITLQAVLISETQIDMIENQPNKDDFEVKGEKIFTPESPHKLQYLEDVKKDELATESPSNDFPILFAAQVLKEGGVSARDELFHRAASLLKEAQRNEEEKITHRLKDLKIDWDQKEIPGHPSAKISLEITNEKGQKLEYLSPGEPARLTLKVFNRGQGAYEQLIGSTTSQDRFFRDQEFIFGKIPAQQSREWSVPITIPTFLSSREVPITIEFQDAHKQAPEPFEARIKVLSPQNPRFRYQYTLIDDGTYNSSGNGDGRIQAREVIALKFTIENVGKVPATEPILNIKNTGEHDLVIKKGHVQLEALPPDKGAEGVVLIRIPTEHKEFKLDLEIRDKKQATMFSDTLTFKAGEPPSPLQNAFHEAPQIVWSRENPYIVAMSKYPLKGVAADDQALKEVYVFVGNQKVFYESNQEAQAQLAFEADLPLEKGPNQILVVTRDQNERVYSDQWLLWRQ